MEEGNEVTLDETVAAGTIAAAEFCVAVALPAPEATSALPWITELACEATLEPIDCAFFAAPEAELEDKFSGAAPCELALEAWTPTVEALRTASFVTGTTTLGKVAAAASVPGPGLEKKTENGVCPAKGESSAADSLDGVDVETPPPLWGVL